MRLSVVFELLLVFLFLAFAAARVVDTTKNTAKNVAKGQKTTTLRQGPPNRYCACTSRMCNCCRDFSLPVVPIKGPGCASIMYVQRDTMSVTMSFGDRVLSNTTITGRTPKPICMALPGGISQFCGRIYGISRKGDQFRACLGLELRALDDIEAALRVSCFKFGPKGVKLESAPPVPAETGDTKDPEDDDDDDDYDLDDDEDDDLIGFGDDDDDGTSSEDNEVDSDPVDYTGFSVLGEDLLGSFFSDDSGGSSSKKKKVTKKTAKPQVVVPKVSTTTRRPVLPIIRRSTVKPLQDRVTVRPLINRVTKRPRPQIVQNFVVPSGAVLSSVQTTSVPVASAINRDKNRPSKRPSTISTIVKTTLASTTSIPTTAEIQKLETQKIEMQKVSNKVTTEATDPPVTFTLPTEKIEVVKNDIKLPQMDLEKVEAVAAIAQQDVTSGVISSSSLTSEETEKPAEIVTIRYEKTTPVTTYMPANTEKINSVKFVPTTVVTSKPSAEVNNESTLLDEIVNGEITGGTGVTAIKNRITAFYQSTETTVNEDDEEEENYSNDDKEKEVQKIENTKIQRPSTSSQGNFTIISVKKQQIKPQNDKSDDEEEVDVIEGVLSDEEDSEEDNEHEEQDGESQIVPNKKPANAESDEQKDNDGDYDDDDIEESVEVHKKSKPTKKKPEEDSDTDDDDDILGILEDDDDDDEDNDEDDDSEESDDEDKQKVTTQKTKIKIPTTQITPTSKKPAVQVTQNIIKKPSTTQTIKTKIPSTHVTQTIITKTPMAGQTVWVRKPETTTEKLMFEKVPEEKVTETMTEKIFIYQQPVDKVTEKVIIYKEPESPETPQKVFIYTEPMNKPPQDSTDKVFIYKKPIESVTEKIFIYKEPVILHTTKPFQTVMNDGTKIAEEEEDSNEEVENDEDSDEEEDEAEPEKGTLFASIIKDRPEFSNKYAEEHDLSDGEDLDIEDSDDEGNDFEEDRKLKQKKQISPKAKLPVNAEAAKILSLSDLIGRPKKYYDNSKDSRPISTSRTHRRMNLDRLLQK